MHKKKKMKNMKENEPEKYQAYLEKMRLYLKVRREKIREFKNSKKINVQEYIYILKFLKIILYRIIFYIKLLKA